MLQFVVSFVLGCLCVFSEVGLVCLLCLADFVLVLVLVGSWLVVCVWYVAGW